MPVPSFAQVDRSAAERSRSRRSLSRVFAHSRLDSLLVGLAGVQFALLVYGTWSCGRVHWSVTLGLGAICVFLTSTNFQCIAHNFIHNPFFRSRRWNTAFGVFNSLLLGGPQTLYRQHHLHHHKYNNDLPDPRTGMPNDFTSTWRYGHPPTREENIVTYALLGYFRSDFSLLFREAQRRHLMNVVGYELAALGAMLVFMATTNLRGLLYFYFPVWFLGNAAAIAENYMEHNGAIPGNRQTDSVCCYNPLYNFVWFNNGYHQEHHYRPQVHWTRIADIRRLLPPESQRRVVRGAHWFNFFPVRRRPGQ